MFSFSIFGSRVELMFVVFFVKVELIILPNSSALSSNVSPTSSVSCACAVATLERYNYCLIRNYKLITPFAAPT